jgi:hypothetical protein
VGALLLLLYVSDCLLHTVPQFDCDMALIHTHDDISPSQLSLGRRQRQQTLVGSATDVGSPQSHRTPLISFLMSWHVWLVCEPDYCADALIHVCSCNMAHTCCEQDQLPHVQAIAVLLHVCQPKLQVPSPHHVTWNTTQFTFGTHTIAEWTRDLTRTESKTACFGPNGPQPCSAGTCCLGYADLDKQLQVRTVYI